jgi:aryl-alcohol dehydrogenase-like predicted oxidoreductase
MRYRRLGQTDLEVSEIAFGTGDNAGLMTIAPEADRFRTFERALSIGINYFDTSPDYGKGRAEENLGTALKRFGREAGRPLYVSSKIEIMPDEVDDIVGKIVASTEASLRRLQVDYIDVMMIHNPPRSTRDPSAAHWLPLTPADMLGPALDGLERMREQGKVRWFGFTCESAEPGPTKQVLSSRRYHAINCWYNMVNPTAGMKPDGVRYGSSYDDYDGVITHAGECGVGVAVIRPLSGGALTPQVIEQGAAGRHAHAGGIYTRKPAAFTPEIERGRAFAFLHQPPRSLPVAAYLFALEHDAVSTVVGGFSDNAQLEEVATLERFARLSREEWALIREAYANNFHLERADRQPS